MVKLLLVVCNNELNGTERYVVDLAANLPTETFDVTIATPLNGPLSDIIFSKGLKEFVYDNGKIDYYSLGGLWKLFRFINKNKIDIVHANSKFQPCIIAKLAGAKLAIETKHGIFYSKQQLENLPLWRRIYERIKQYFVDAFIATSENDKQTLIKYFKIKENKISVIYLGIDFDDIKNKKAISGNLNLQKETIKIGHIGRFTFQKAQEILLEAFKILSQKNFNLELIMVGKGENEKKLKEYVANNNLSGKVKFRGYIKEIYKEMSTFDMHVLTSRYEGTGYVNLEAMALGIPVVATEVGGANNFFADGYDILLTKVEDPVSTAAAIQKIISDEVLKQNLINNAYKTVSKYTIKRMGEETSAFYLKHLR